MIKIFLQNLSSKNRTLQTTENAELSTCWLTSLLDLSLSLSLSLSLNTDISVYHFAGWRDLQITV